MTVTGFIHQCPLLRFVGKSDRVSDLVGEKLNEPHVHRVLDGIFKDLQLVPSFAMLVPAVEMPPRYRLYYQISAAQRRSVDVDRLAALLQSGLEENPHYRLAIGLGQLSPVEICLLDDSGQSAWKMVERQRISQGQKPGDIKPTMLDTWTGWADVFAAAKFPVA